MAAKKTTDEMEPIEEAIESMEPVTMKKYRCTEDCTYEGHWHGAGEIIEIASDVKVTHTKLQEITDTDLFDENGEREIYDPKTENLRARERIRVMDGILTRN